jgi:hypothetical protein
MPSPDVTAPAKHFALYDLSTFLCVSRHKNVKFMYAHVIKGWRRKRKKKFSYLNLL